MCLLDLLESHGPESLNTLHSAALPPHTANNVAVLTVMLSWCLARQM